MSKRALYLAGFRERDDISVTDCRYQSANKQDAVFVFPSGFLDDDGTVAKAAARSTNMMLEPVAVYSRAKRPTSRKASRVQLVIVVNINLDRALRRAKSLVRFHNQPIKLSISL